MTDPVDRSDALDEKLAGAVGIERSVHDLMRASRRSQLLIRILGASVAFDILLSLALGYVAFTAQTAANQANSAQQQQRSACMSGNQARAVDRQLWDYILALPPTTPQSSAQQQQREDFRAYIARAFAARNC